MDKKSTCICCLLGYPGTVSIPKVDREVTEWFSNYALRSPWSNVRVLRQSWFPTRVPQVGLRFSQITPSVLEWTWSGRWKSQTVSFQQVLPAALSFTWVSSTNIISSFVWKSYSLICVSYKGIYSLNDVWKALFKRPSFYKTRGWFWI